MRAVERKKFKYDINRNKCSPLKKKWWILFCLRSEQSCVHVIPRRLFAACKKILLFGSGCELPASAFRGGGVLIPHLNGIFINPSARLGSGCAIYHQVTIGAGEKDETFGAPCLGDNVVVYAGAKVIGPISVGNDVVIGANAVVTKNIASDVTVVGANRIVVNHSNKELLEGQAHGFNAK